MLERFSGLATPRSCKVIVLANREAKNFNHQYIGTEHILLGLVEEGSGVGCDVLKNFGLDLDKIRSETKKLVKTGPEKVNMEVLSETPRAKKVIEYAIEEMEILEHQHLGTEHLLLGLLREQDGIAAQVLMNLNLRLEDMRAEVLKILAPPNPRERVIAAVKELGDSVVAFLDHLESPHSK